MINWDNAMAFDLKHNVAQPIFDGFEAEGLTAHDLGLIDALAVVKAWEKIRTPEMVADLGEL